MSAIVVLLYAIGAMGILVGAIRADARMNTSAAATVRRLFQYLLLYALLVTVLFGTATIMARLLGAPADPWDTDNYELAQALAFVVIGGPAFALISWLAMRYNRRHPQEWSFPLYAYYLGAASLTALILVGAAIPDLSRALVANFSAVKSAATICVSLVAGLAYWRLMTGTLPETLRQQILLAGSLLGLFYLVDGFVGAVSASVNILWSAPDAISTAYPLVEGLFTLVFGSLVWTVYWVLAAQKAPRTTTWFLLTLPVGVGGGLVAMIGAGSSFLWSVLVWMVGNPGEVSAAEHFAATAAQFSLALAGLIMWLYFRAVLGPPAQTPRPAYSAYVYLLSGIGLGACLAGAASIITAGIRFLSPGTLPENSPINALLLGAVFLVAGAPLWLIFWNKANRQASLFGLSQEGRAARRTYLFAVLWLSAAVLVISLVSVAVTVFGGVVSGGLTAATATDASSAIGYVIAAAAVFVFHLSALRAGEDEDAFRAEETASPTGAYAGEEPLIDTIRQMNLGSRFRVVAPLASGRTAGELRAELATTSEPVVVVVEASGWMLAPALDAPPGQARPQAGPETGAGPDGEGRVTLE